MVFVTVGTDGPFDRLVQAIDLWAGQSGRTDVFAQIGRTSLRPSHIAYSQMLEPPEFHRRFLEADVVIAHAGMGTILSALRYGKPILVMPRRASLGEQRNEHQLATARHLAALGKIQVAMDERELRARLDHLTEVAVLDRTGPYASQSLTDAIQAFIHGRR
ncbi:MAG: glucuronosyltransferase [Opitutaceae bacterium]|nr:glucuronosyltransferase [Opitutaceae bacterium]